jgi:hypothetical protein
MWRTNGHRVPSHTTAGFVRRVGPVPLVTLTGSSRQCHVRNPLNCGRLRIAAATLTLRGASAANTSGIGSGVVQFSVDYGSFPDVPAQPDSRHQSVESLDGGCSVPRLAPSMRESGAPAVSRVPRRLGRSPTGQLLSRCPCVPRAVL